MKMIEDFCGQYAYNLKICTEETKRLEQWLSKHQPGSRCWIEENGEGGLGNTPYSVIISPSSFGNFVEVRCNTCGEIANITHEEHI